MFVELKEDLSKRCNVKLFEIIFYSKDSKFYEINYKKILLNNSIKEIS